MEQHRWSEGLRQQTRDSIAAGLVSPHDGRLHFKHWSDSYAFITLNDLLQGQLVLTDKESGQPFEFEDTDALINEGWVID